MSEHDRGAYAPPTADSPLSFDARRPVRGARPFPVTLIVSGLVLLALILAIFGFYRSGMHQGAQAPQAVGAPVADIKGPPPADAQPQDPAAGLQIYRSEHDQSPAQAAQQPQFAPPPEQPAPRPTLAAPPPPAAAPTTPVTIAQAPPLRPAPAPAAVPPPPVAVPHSLPPPVAISPPPAPPKPTAQPAPATAAAGGAAVQIGAVSTTALADQAWSQAVALAPGMAAGKGKGVEKIDKDGHVLYRTAVTGFASRADAAAFCARLKAAGKACFVK